MKQIICKRCIDSSKKLIRQHPPSERVTFKRGKAIYAMYCDLCASLIEEKEICYARTITRFSEKKEKWEDEYIRS